MVPFCSQLPARSALLARQLLLRRVTPPIRPFEPFSAAERRAVADEAEQLLALAGGDAELRDVRFQAP